MINNRNKKLEKKRKKREEKRRRIKNNPPSVRNQHVGKDLSERMEYIKFIENDDIDQQQTGKEQRKEDDLDKTKILGEKKEALVDKTSDPISDSKSLFVDEGIPEKKKKITKWCHFKNRWNRKWADNLIDDIFHSIFFVITTMISLIVGYFFAKNTFQRNFDNFIKDINNPKSEIRSEIKKEIILETENNIKQKIEDSNKNKIFTASSSSSVATSSNKILK